MKCDIVTSIRKMVFKPSDISVFKPLKFYYGSNELWTDYHQISKYPFIGYNQKIGISLLDAETKLPNGKILFLTKYQYEKLIESQK